MYGSNFVYVSTMHCCFRVPQKFAGGNQTASALLRFAIGLGCDFEDIRKKIKIEKAYPFNSAKKQVRGVRCVKVTIKTEMYFVVVFIRVRCW